MGQFSPRVVAALLRDVPSQLLADQQGIGSGKDLRPGSARDGAPARD